MLKACVQAIVRNPTLAEDTFSDVTLEIVRSWERFDQARPFEPWARGVGREPMVRDTWRFREILEPRRLKARAGLKGVTREKTFPRMLRKNN
jgi:hypothetical protein